MRILIYGLNFEPEQVGTGKFTGEMAHHLARQGHAVRVVTAPPYYPAWRIQPGYSGWRYRTETRETVQVVRCPLWVPPRPSGASRLLHLLSFALSSAPALLAQAGWRPDLLLAVAPTIASAPAAWLGARLFGCPAWLHLQDFELEAALKLQMIPGGRGASRLLVSSEKWLLQRFDHISTISARMQERLWQKDIPAQRTSLLPNWVDCQDIFPQQAPNPFRQAWGLAEEDILVLYSGSMGEKQGLELLIQAARQLQHLPHLRFVLCGEGSARPRLEALAAGSNNLRFLPLQPAERLHDLLNAADMHVLIQRTGAADLVMPSKLAGMLASGRAVIATAEPDTELARVASQAGRLIPPEDLQALCQAIVELGNQPDLRRALGERGRAYAQENFDRAIILARLEHTLRQVVHRPEPTV